MPKPSATGCAMRINGGTRRGHGAVERLARRGREELSCAQRCRTDAFGKRANSLESVLAAARQRNAERRREWEGAYASTVPGRIASGRNRATVEGSASASRPPKRRSEDVVEAAMRHDDAIRRTSNARARRSTRPAAASTEEREQRQEAPGDVQRQMRTSCCGGGTRRQPSHGVAECPGRF